MISLTQYHNGVAVYHHRFELVLLLESFRVVHEIEGIDSGLDLKLVFSITLCEYVLAAAGVSRASLLHEFGEHTGSICLFPFIGHACEQLVSHGFAFPVRDYYLFLVFEVLLCDRIVDD